MLRRLPPSAAVVIFLCLAALLGCGQAGFCPDCAKSTAVTSLHYPAATTLGEGTAAPAQQPNPSGGTPTTYAVVAGTLPPGMALDPATGALTGTPTAPGVFSFTIQASNAAGATSQVLDLTVLPGSPLALGYPTPMVFPAGTPIALQPPAVSFATPGIPVTFAVTASTAVTSAVRASARVAPALPAGLVLNADGSITGTPTVAGVYDFTITATNGTRSADTSLHYTVTPSTALALGYTLPASVTSGSAIAAQVPALANATPGVPTTYTVTTGTLPAGLSLNADGSITGTPAGPGVYTFTVTAANGTETSSTVLTLTVAPAAPLTLAYTAPQNLTAGSPMSALAPALANAVPGLPVTYAVTSGSLPAGLVLNADGSVSGTPTTPGTSTFTITASNGVQSADDPLTITTLPAGTMTLNYTAPATFTQGAAISALAPSLAYTLPGAATTFAVTSGTLPSGLVLNPDGTITGTPDTPGVSTFTITAYSGTLSAQASLALTVIGASPLGLDYPAAGPFTQGTAIALQAPDLAHATPGIATVYAVTGGTLPAGLALNPDGTITGTPTAPGVYAFTITSTNGTQSASANVAYTVYGSAPLALAYASPAAFTQGAAIAAQAAAVTGSTPGLATGFALTTGSLPTGLALNADGSITGTPTVAGVFTFTITATNGTRTAQAAATYTVVPASALTLAYATPATFTQGTAIASQAPALGNAIPGVATTFAVTSGTLPAGLVLNADGSISGTPSAAGLSSFTITATNGTRTAAGGATYTVVPSAALTLAYATPATFTQGSAIAAQNPTLANATPGVPATYALTAGSLPAGLALNADGSISGTPSAAGISTFTITATNGTRTATGGATYTVVPSAALTLAYATPATFTQGSAIAAQNPTLANATPGVPTTYALTAGSLPAGLALNADGSISGTPSAAGLATFTIKVTNGTRTAQASATYTVESSGALTLSYPTPLTFTQGTAIATQSPSLGNATPGLATTYALTTGALPNGLALNLDGTVTGTPLAAGSFSWTIRASNGTRTASATVACTVNAAAPTALNYQTPVTYTAGYAIATNSANASGGPPSSYAVTSGSLPAGLSLDTSTGDITGTPTTAVTGAPVTIRGTNATGSASQTLSITVLGMPTASLSANPSIVPMGQASSLTALLTNGTGVLSGGSLASPVAVSDGASVTTGNVNVATTYTYTLTVTSPQGHVVTSTAQVQWVTPPANLYTTSISSSGGTYTPPSGNPLYGQVTVAVPAQTASCGASTLTVTTEASLPGAVPSGAQVCSSLFNIATDVGYPFQTPMTISLAYDPSLTTPALTASDMPMAFFWDSTYGAWVSTGIKALDTTGHQVTFTSLLPGRYVVMAIPGLAAALASQNPGFSAGTDGWLQNNLDIYDLPNGASLGMASLASWYFDFAKGVNGNPGLYSRFASASDPSALAFISRLANGTLNEWAQLWQQSSYGLTGTQTGLALVTGLKVTGQPQLLLMADAKPAVNNALATLAYSYNASTGKFGILDPNYPGNVLSLTWTAGTGAFSNYDRAMAYSPALAAFAFEGQTSVHRLADYETLLDGAETGYPASSYASIAVDSVGGTSSPDLAQTVYVPSASNVVVSGTVTNGDQAETSLFWSQNLDAPRTQVALTPVDSTHSSFSFSIPALSDPYGTTVMLETSSNPCDPTFSHSGFQTFTLAQSGLSPWFPDACFESSSTSIAPWVNVQGSNSAKYYPNPTSPNLNTFDASGNLQSFSITWSAATVGTVATGTGNSSTPATYSALVTDPSHTNDANMGGTSPVPDVLDGSNALRVCSPPNGSHISKVSQTLTVPTTVSHPKLSFYWAFVAQSAGHIPEQEPFVDIVVYDLTATEVLYYVHHFPPSTVGSTNYTDGYPGWVAGTGTLSSQWYGINWQKVSLNLGTARGNHNILVSVTAAGCTQGGHGGYAYLDSIGCN